MQDGTATQQWPVPFPIAAAAAFTQCRLCGYGRLHTMDAVLEASMTTTRKLGMARHRLSTA